MVCDAVTTDTRTFDLFNEFDESLGKHDGSGASMCICWIAAHKLFINPFASGRPIKESVIFGMIFAPRATHGIPILC